MLEPNFKRFKTYVDEQDFFINFLRDENKKQLIKQLRVTLQELECGSSNLTVSFLKVKDANATSGVDFKFATCEVTRALNEANKKFVLPTGLLFLDGYVVLETFLAANNPGIPEDPKERRALKELLQFLANDETIFNLIKNRNKKDTKCMLMARYAQDLLIPLVPLTRFIIDQTYPSLQLRAYGTDAHPMSGKGDTSFGCARGWHGQVDVLASDKAVPISLMADNDDVDTVSEHSDSAVEAKTGGGLLLQDLQQMMAQTITCSFLHRKQNATDLNKSLVPGIGICSDKLFIHMYDCEEDVLLGLYPLDLFVANGKELSTRTIVVLWLMLNYDLFCSGLPESFRKYKANFHNILGPDYLAIYRNAVTYPFQIKLRETSDYVPLWSGTYPIVTVKDFVLPEKKLISIVNRQREMPGDSDV